jgi:hypothetical protein
MYGFNGLVQGGRDACQNATASTAAIDGSSKNSKPPPRTASTNTTTTTTTTQFHTLYPRTAQLTLRVLRCEGGSMLSKDHDGLARQKRKRGDKQKRSTTTTSAPADASLFPPKKQHISSRADRAFSHRCGWYFLLFSFVGGFSFFPRSSQLQLPLQPTPNPKLKTQPQPSVQTAQQPPTGNKQRRNKSTSAP